MGVELHGKTLGVLGLGRVGREVVSRMQVIVLAHTLPIQSEIIVGLRLTYVSIYLYIYLLSRSRSIYIYMYVCISLSLSLSYSNSP